METDILNNIDLNELGRRLQEARKKRHLTQEEAAKVIDVARTTITAIEKGERRIRVEELINLARAYGSQISDFVRPRPKLEPFDVQFRGPYMRTIENEEEIKPYIDELEDRVRDYLELETITKSPLIRKYPAQYEIEGLPTEQAAENVAIEERNRLGLGDGAISSLRAILEQDVGLRIFYYPIGAPKFCAIYLYNEQLGGCIAVNSLHPEERRCWSLAHDYGHFLVHRYRATVSVADYYQRTPESERFADSFAMYFLMPTSGLMRRVNDIKRTKGTLTPADLCVFAHYYGVSVEAFTRRLEMMKLVPTGIWDRLRPLRLLLSL